MKHHHYSFGSFIHDVGKVTKPIGHDIKCLVSGADKDFNHIINTQSNIANNIVNKGASTLVIVGGVVLVYFITKK